MDNILNSAIDSLTSEENLNGMIRQSNEACCWYIKKNGGKWKFVYDLAAALNDCVSAIRRHRAEISHLHKIIKDAPHDVRLCDRFSYNYELEIFIEDKDIKCTCWKQHTNK